MIVRENLETNPSDAVGWLITEKSILADTLSDRYFICRVYGK